jgi:predicted nucleic acid-binding protein
VEHYLIALAVAGSQFDCLIAATAILAQAEFATENRSDFTPFVAHGLKLAA